jgi:hypothetical protein
LRAKLGVDAGRAQEEQPVGLCAVTCVDDVGLNNEVFADEVCGIEIIGQDAADLGRSQKHVIGAFLFEEGAHGDRVGQIQLCV